MRRHDYYDQLRDVELFAGLDRKSVRLVGSITTSIDRPAGTVLIEEGRPGLEAFVVIDGEASVTVDGREVGVVGPGEVVGEVALLDNRPRTATVTALTPMRVLVLSRAEFNTLLDRVPDVTRKILATVQARAGHGVTGREALAS